MLSDEEEILIKKLRYCEQEYEQNGYLSVGKFKAIKEASNLIEKQSKEIEELKNGQIDFWISDKEIEERIRNKFVSKDKIKAKIEEFKKVRDTILENEKELNRPMMTYDLKRNDYCEKMLQSLLEKEL